MKKNDVVRYLDEAFEVINKTKSNRGFSFNDNFKEVKDRVMKSLSTLPETQLYAVLPMQQNESVDEVPKLRHQRGGLMDSHKVLTMTYGTFFKKELVFDPLLYTWFRMEEYARAAYENNLGMRGMFPINKIGKWRK